MRDFLVVEILPNRDIGEPAERREDERDPFLFDETPRLFDGLRRAVAVVETEEIELAAVDAALFVDHLETRGFRPANETIGGRWTAVGHGLAKLDLGIGDAGRIDGPRGPEPRSEICGGGATRLQEYATRHHGFLPL